MRREESTSALSSFNSWELITEYHYDSEFLLFVQCFKIYKTMLHVFFPPLGSQLPYKVGRADVIPKSQAGKFELRDVKPPGGTCGDLT